MTKPDDFNQRAGNADGGIAFIACCSETDEGKRTVHLDASHSSTPYGHMGPGSIKTFTEWLVQAARWVGDGWEAK